MPAAQQRGNLPAGHLAVRVARFEDLFHAFDPAPLACRALADPVEAYLVTKAGPLPSTMPLTIVVHGAFELAEAAVAAGGLTGLFQRHFGTRQGEIAQELAGTTQRGLRYLALGMSLLVVTMVLGYLGKKYLFPEPYGTFIETGLSVFGWVANWRPVETLLYERLLIKRRLALYARLAGADVECHPDNP